MGPHRIHTWGLTASRAGCLHACAPIRSSDRVWGHSWLSMHVQMLRAVTVAHSAPCRKRAALLTAEFPVVRP